MLRRFFCLKNKKMSSPASLLLLFGEKTVPAASWLSPCGRRSLSLFSDCSLRSRKVKDFSIRRRALRAYLNSSFLILHCPSRAPRPPCVKGERADRRRWRRKEGERVAAVGFFKQALRAPKKAGTATGAVTGGDWGIGFSPSPSIPHSSFLILHCFSLTTVTPASPSP